MQVGNQDVWTGSSWGDIWRHDFWGQEIAHAESHKSFRPLTTVTFKYVLICGNRITFKQSIFMVVYGDFT